MDKITVVMATYNGEKYIEEQLVSILNQSYPPDEVIIRDDCSTDNTCRIIKDFIGNNNLNWVLIPGDKNLGFERNFTEALKCSTGDLIFLSDQDDVWHKGKIKYMSSVMNRYKQILCLNSSFECIDSCGERINTKNMPFTSNNGLIIGKTIKDYSLCSFKAEEVLRYNISMGCTLAFRKELMNEYLANAGKVAHDWLINMIAASHGGLFFLNRKLIRYRVHGDNTIGLNEGFIQEKEKRNKTYSNMLRYYYAFSRTRLIRRNPRLYKSCTKNISLYSERIRVINRKTYQPILFVVLKSLLKFGFRGLLIIRDIAIRSWHVV